MAKLTFLGGIHPYDGKDLSKDKPIRTIFPKGDLVYPLSQHIGAPATAVVAKGDRVLVGQKIAEASGFVSAPIYASVSGTVKAIEPRRVVTGDNPRPSPFWRASGPRQPWLPRRRSCPPGWPYSGSMLRRHGSPEGFRR